MPCLRLRRSVALYWAITSIPRVTGDSHGIENRGRTESWRQSVKMEKGKYWDKVLSEEQGWFAMMRKAVSRNNLQSGALMWALSHMGGRQSNPGKLS